MLVMSVAKEIDHVLEGKTDHKIKKRQDLKTALRKNLLRRKNLVNNIKNKSQEK